MIVRKAQFFHFIHFLMKSLLEQYKQFANKLGFMKNQHLTNFQVDPQKQPFRNSSKFERNKNTCSFKQQMFRNQNQISDLSPSQTSQTNNLSKTKSRLKSTRIKSKNGKCIYYELESTKKNQEEVLRQQNIELKKIIAELKISQFYQINEGKLKSLILELDQLKDLLNKVQKQNEKLRIQNDFLTRSNFQLKLENSRLRKKYEINDSISKDRKNKIGQLPQKRIMQINQNNQVGTFSNALPHHLLLTDRKQYVQSNRGMRISQNEISNQIGSSRYKQDGLNGLLRIKSQKLLGMRQISQARLSRKLSKKKTVNTEVQNKQSAFQ